MKHLTIRPGAIDELAADLGAKSSHDTAMLLGITTDQLEQLRFGLVTPTTAAVLANRVQQFRRAADTLDTVA